MENLKFQKVVPSDPGWVVWYDAESATPLDDSSMCSLLIHADHAYIAFRFTFWAAGGRMHALAFHLAAQSAELYLKAFLVSRRGELPRAWTSGRQGHDLARLARHAADVDPSNSSFFEDESRISHLRMLTPMAQAGRYPGTGYRGPAGNVTAMVYWFDSFAHDIRRLVPYPDTCRDDIVGMTSKEPNDDTFGGGSALRRLFLAFNRPFGGWFLTDDDQPVRLDGTPW